MKSVYGLHAECRSEVGGPSEYCLVSDTQQMLGMHSWKGGNWTIPLLQDTHKYFPFNLLVSAAPGDKRSPTRPASCAPFHAMLQTWCSSVSLTRLLNKMPVFM